MAGAMTKIRSYKILAYFHMEVRGLFTFFIVCLFYFWFIVVFVSDFAFLFTLYGHLVCNVCHKMTVLEELNQE